MNSIAVGIALRIDDENMNSTLKGSENSWYARFDPYRVAMISATPDRRRSFSLPDHSGLKNSPLLLARFARQAKPRFDSFVTTFNSGGNILADNGSVFEAVT